MNPPILVGTSSFTATGWSGSFYPVCSRGLPGLDKNPSSERLLDELERLISTSQDVRPIQEFLRDHRRSGRPFPCTHLPCRTIPIGNAGLCVANHDLTCFHSLLLLRFLSLAHRFHWSDMGAIRATSVERTAEAGFVASWEEAISLHRALPMLRKQMREAHGIDNLQMQFRNPWGGPSHTEFTLIVEVAKGVAGATAAAVAKWLLDMGKDFLRYHRMKAKKPKRVSSRHNSGKKNPARDKKNWE